MAADEVQVEAVSEAGWPGVLRWLLRARAFWLALAIMAGLRAWTIATLPLVPDEAYYWVWSRELSLSYFDHPPMVAWLIRCSTAVLGDSEFAVRLPAAVLSLGAIPIVMCGVRAFCTQPMVGRLAGLVLLLSPVTALVGTITTPDAPVFFFGCGAIAAAAWAVRDESGRGKWLVFGTLLGLAMLSKYTGALIAPAVFLMLAVSRAGRIHLARPWFWMGAAIAAIVFSPVLVWNARHDWASFAFQLGHGLKSTDLPAWRGVGEFLGGLCLAWTPIHFVLTLLALIHLSRTAKAQPPAVRLMLWCMAVPMTLFLFSATRRRVEVNWPLLVAPPAAVLTAMFVSHAGRAIKVVAAAGVIMSGLAALALQVPPLVMGFSWRVGHLGQLYGYEELGREVGRIAEGSSIFCNRYQDAAELAYYVPGHPRVWPLNLESRANAYDYFDRRPDPAQRAVFVNFDVRRHFPEFIITRSIAWPTTVHGKELRVDSIFEVERGPASNNPKEPVGNPGRKAGG